MIGSSAGAFGGVWAAAELRKVLGAMGARVTEAELAVGHAHEKFDADGQLVDDDVRAGPPRRARRRSSRRFPPRSAASPSAA